MWLGSWRRVGKAKAQPGISATVLTEKKKSPGPLHWLTGRLYGRRTAPSIPAGHRVYIVGDIHGCAELLDRLLKLVIVDSGAGPAKQSLVFVGDYVDRGPDSRGVIERLLSLPRQFEPHFLRGNHDQAVLDFLKDPEFYRTWKGFGGQETLLSYGVRPPKFDDIKSIGEAHAQFLAAFPEAHLRFLEALELSREIGDYFVVHAGVRPGVALGAQNSEDLLWIRDNFLFSDNDFGKIIVHGHTPVEAPIRRRNRIGIDTGAYATGRLTALILEGSDWRFLHT